MHKILITILLFIFLFILITDNPAFAQKPYTSPPGSPERKAILDALREGLKHFPDKEPSGIGFKYKIVKDVGVPRWSIEEKEKLIFIVNYLKVRDDWAWVEVTDKNYDVDIVALLNKDGKWEVKGIVHPVYVMCVDYEECIDVKAYIYKRFMERFSFAPADIFPKIEERKQILKVLSNLPALQDFDFKMIFVVKYFKAKNGWAWIETDPRHPYGGVATEPVDFFVHKEKGEWVIKDIRPCCGECMDDPYCAEGIYHKKLMKMFPSAPKEIFPKKTR